MICRGNDVRLSPLRSLSLQGTFLEERIKKVFVGVFGRNYLGPSDVIRVASVDVTNIILSATRSFCSAAQELSTEQLEELLSPGNSGELFKTKTITSLIVSSCINES